MTTLMNDVNEVDDSHVTSAANSSDASKGRHKLQEWLNKNMRIKLTDGRTLIGIFLCTDADCNMILGSCQEYLTDPDLEGEREEPRMLGLAMIPGHHIVSAHIDDTHYS